MKKTLFEQVYEKYGIVIGKRLWCSQIEVLQWAFDAVEQGEQPEKVELTDPFVQVVFDLIVCDLKWQQRKAGAEDEK